MPAAEAMLQICPSSRAIISGSICNATTIGAMVFTSIVRRMSSMVCLSNVLLPRTMPAQLIRMFTSPQSRFTSAYAAATASASDTSTR